MIRHALSVLLLLGATACGLADNERDEKNRRVYLNFYDKTFEAFCLGEYDLDGDGLTSLRTDGLRALVELDCSENPLPLLDLTSNVSLTRFAARGCDFRTLDLANCSAWMESADVRGCRQLETLYLAGRQQGNFYYDGITEVVRR